MRSFKFDHSLEADHRVPRASRQCFRPDWRDASGTQPFPDPGPRPGLSRRALLGLKFVNTLAILLMTASTLAAEGSSDQRFLAGLRVRTLFELAASYCQDRLGDAQLPEARRAELTIELSLTLAEQAVHTAPDQRDPLWQRAVQVVEQFAGRYTDSPQLPLVRLQGALALVARGELARQEAEVVSDSLALLNQAKDALRTAIRQLTELEKQLERPLRESHSQRSPDPLGRSGLTRRQLANLADNVRYQLARALRNQGQCYPADSPDRANSLTQAARLLDPLAKLDPLHPLAWDSRLDEVVCHRLLADYPTAARKLDALAAEKPPAAVQLRARAERLRLFLAAGQLPQALGMLSEGRQQDGAISADLDYAWLETFLEAWRVTDKAKDRQAAEKWRGQAMEMMRLIERTHGPYWARRAEMLLVGRVEAAADGGDLAMQIHAAESAYRSGRADDALAAYDRARALAQAQGNGDRAFELGYVAAAIEHRRNRHEQSLTRYRQLALAYPQHAKAAEAHRLAVYHAGQLARQQAAGAVEQYESLLDEHAQHWPEAASANDVRWRLGQIRQQRGDWQGAVAAYQAITADDPQFLRAVEAIGQCEEALLKQRQAAGEATDQRAAATAGWLEGLIVGPQQELPERWSPVAQTAALAASRLRLYYTTTGFARAERVLTEALRGSPDASAEWKSTAQVLLVFCLAAQGRHAEASAILKQIPAGSPEALLNMLSALGRVSATAPERVRAELARLQLGAVDLLRPRRSQLSAADQGTLDRLYAQALAESGRTDEALRVYQELANAHPRDGEIQEAYAALLVTRSDRPSLETALTKWRELEDKSKPRTPRWFRAKYHLAELHYRLGNPEQTVKMVTLLEVLHPDLGGPEMRNNFLKLLDRCR